ncbi:Uu.00g113230.m01.CDS01 [Anthostomella pinea]|uniref:Uu.00g113230.m01.CDS01 n=1 Tax=Anthostomella pinea TaxID=933095 RepID=A0AAI8YGI5_9PEZI|nr:Uu.00g113230.m01.CDS01 [Anthostomella pinea]
MFLRSRFTDATLLDPFAEAEETPGESQQTQNYIHIRIQRAFRPAIFPYFIRDCLETARFGPPVEVRLPATAGLPKKFDQKKILKVIKKKFACNGTIVTDTEMGEVILLQGDQRKDVQEFLTNKKEGLDLDGKTIKVHGF